MHLPIPQPVPWTPIPNREIADGGGNIVQYTDANIGIICLAVNFHAKIMALLSIIEPEVPPHIREMLREATGRIGPGVVADMLSRADEPSTVLDQAIAAELQIPIMSYTSSTDMSMMLIPKPWVCAFKPLMTDEGEMRGMEVTLMNGEQKISVLNKNLPMAICIASMRARVT